MGSSDNFRKVKDLTSKGISMYYRDKGLAKTKSLCLSILNLCKHSKADREFLANFKGEACEALLECIIKDFMNKHKKETEGWFIDRGLIINDLDNPDSPYLTEIDLVLFTSYKILVFECKSYNGDKVFTDECTVNRKGMKSVNVYDQHKKHFKALIKHVRRFRNSANPDVSPLQISYFDFSLGTIKDDREKKWKLLMPITSVLNIDKLLNTYLDKPYLWNMSKMEAYILSLDKHKKENSRKQVEYVKSIHHS